MSTEPSRRGFASMDKERQRDIASKGGKAAHAGGNAHEFSSTEAQEAGRKGGQAVSKNREYMAQIGAKGGASRRRAKDEKAPPTNKADGAGRHGSGLPPVTP